MTLASVGAMLTTSILLLSRLSGIVSVTKSFSKGEASIFSVASSERTGCVTKAATFLAPLSKHACAAFTREPPVSIMSSKSKAFFPFTSPTTCVTKEALGLGRCLCTIAISPLKRSARRLAFFAPPLSVETTSIFRVKPDFLYSRRNKLGDGNVPEVTVHETLDLVGVQVNRNQIVHAGAHYQVGDKLCGNRLAGLCLAVLPRVAQVRDDRSDFLGIASPRSVAQNQEFHERVVDRKLFSLFGKGIANALQNENVLSPQAFVD